MLWASLLAWPFGGWWLPAASLTALAIALLTVGAHSYAVARQQPSGALLYE